MQLGGTRDEIDKDNEGDGYESDGYNGYNGNGKIAEAEDTAREFAYVAM